jgi:hypothetical protein
MRAFMAGKTLILAMITPGLVPHQFQTRTSLMGLSMCLNGSS